MDNELLKIIGQSGVQMFKLRTEHADQPGAPETYIEEYILQDGRKVERVCSVSYGREGIECAGFLAREIK